MSGKRPLKRVRMDVGNTRYYRTCYGLRASRLSLNIAAYVRDKAVLGHVDNDVACPAAGQKYAFSKQLHLQSLSAA
jgi:hypothetical protein